MFDFKYLNRAQLAELINSEAYKTMPIVPISRQRAISHIRNSRAAADDILLVLAYQNEVLVGYLGLFPDCAYPAEGQIYRFAWLSTLWLHDAMRGKGLGGEIVQRGIAAYTKRACTRQYSKTLPFFGCR